ncbi:MAG: hypothetical protein ABI910_14185 [Gemmatimonadota bacterium]
MRGAAVARRAFARGGAVACALLSVGCKPAATPAPAPSPDSQVTPVGVPRNDTPIAPGSTGQDSAALLVPAGYGSLRQDDIALRVSQFGLQVRAIPLDETVIRVLSPDSYRAMHEIVASQLERLTALQRRTALPRLSLWYVSFFAIEQGETRFSPMEFNISNVGRDFQPIDVIPLSPGFGSQRLRQREVQSGLYVFDGQVDVNQPLAIVYETARNDEWSILLHRIERERALARSRAAARP